MISGRVRLSARRNQMRAVMTRIIDRVRDFK